MTSFVDRVVLHVAGGDGGNGCASVMREKFKPLGGPDGGNGGNGGTVTLVVDAGAASLLEYHHSPHRRATSGRPGQGDHRNGAQGGDLVLPVPDGTVVSSTDGQILADLVGEGSQYVVAAGGRGGLGNAALASSRRKAPGFALLGEPGNVRSVVLELKSVADVALVGYPSSGKSSLVAALSAARPKIADYPFTTLVPNLGVVQADGDTFTVADVPGLIPGASDGKGLGLEFLRHIERCAVVVHVLDAATLETERDPLADLDVIEAELAAFAGRLPVEQVTVHGDAVQPGLPPLLERPRLVALNKIDLPDGRSMVDLVTPELEARGYRVFPISAATREGLRPLTFAMVEHVRAARAVRDEAALRPNRIVLRPTAVNDVGFTVAREGNRFRVRGTKPERWVRQTEFSNDEAVGYLADRLARLGVEGKLAELGATRGSEVTIGSDDDAVVFDFEPTIEAGSHRPGRRGVDERLVASNRVRAEQRKAEKIARRIGLGEFAAFPTLVLDGTGVDGLIDVLDDDVLDDDLLDDDLLDHDLLDHDLLDDDLLVDDLATDDEAADGDPVVDVATVDADRKEQA